MISDFRLEPARRGGISDWLRGTYSNRKSEIGNPKYSPFWLVLLLATASCTTSKTAPSGPPASAPAGIEKIAERGPVKMVVRADKSQVTIAERLGLTIEVTAAEGVDVTMPSFGTQLNEFQIRDFREENAKPVDGGRRWRQTYDLDIFLSGEYSIPPITARFVDRRKAAPRSNMPTSAAADEGMPPSGEGLQAGERARSDGDQSSASGVIEGEVATEPFTMKVTSLLAGEFEPTKFRDIKGPVALAAAPARVRLWWIFGGAAVVVAAVAAIWLVVRRRRVALERAIPAHEWAFDQLRMLIDEKLIEAGLIHEFYFRLSLIVREYIERRFGLMAPERTTEEFLIEMRSSPALTSEQKGLLGDFLSACDMVKFALYQPNAKEIEQAFDAARDFVEQTAPPQESPPQSEIGNLKSEIFKRGAAA